jgi:hypothetical protein
MRIFVLVHRYLGIALGLLMVMWCLSGIVMMYVGYPALDKSVRSAHLEAIDWIHCCRINEGGIGTDFVIARAEIEMLAGQPVLMLTGTRGRKLIDLVSGELIEKISTWTAEAVAERYGHVSAPAQSLSFDQWTVSGGFNPDRPLLRVALANQESTVLYVSGTTGQVVQVTTVRQRFWNWFGAIPHWLYFADLRRRPELWRVTVISLATAGTFLTIVGLYIGVHRLVQRPIERWSPFRGLKLWHHALGLLFGILTLTWVLSGLLSMNPGGLLEREDARPGPFARGGISFSLSQLMTSLMQLAAREPAAVRATASLFNGRLYWLVSFANGDRQRVDESAHPAPLDSVGLLDAGKAIGGWDSLDLLESEDAYYFAHPGDKSPLPVYRIMLDDPARTIYYIDPISGDVIAQFGAGDRDYRWWHGALHQVDFARLIRQRPFWDVLMLCLLAGVSAVCVTGAFLAFKPLLGALFRCRQG